MFYEDRCVSPLSALQILGGRSCRVSVLLPEPNEHCLALPTKLFSGGWIAGLPCRMRRMFSIHANL